MANDFIPERISYNDPDGVGKINRGFEGLAGVANSHIKAHGGEIDIYTSLDALGVAGLTGAPLLKAIHEKLPPNGVMQFPVVADTPNAILPSYARDYKDQDNLDPGGILIYWSCHDPAVLAFEGTGFRDCKAHGAFSADDTEVKWRENWGVIRLYVDGTNGDDENGGVKQNRPIKTLAEVQKRFERLQCQSGFVGIYLAKGEYLLDNVLHLEGNNRVDIVGNGSTIRVTGENQFAIRTSFVTDFRISGLNVIDLRPNTGETYIVHGSGIKRVIANNIKISCDEQRSQNAFFFTGCGVVSVSDCTTKECRVAVVTWITGRALVTGSTLSGYRGIYNGSSHIVVSNCTFDTTQQHYTKEEGETIIV